MILASLFQKIPERIIDFVSSRLFLKLTFAYFFVQSIFFALSIKFGIPPDEAYHLGFIDFFLQNNFSPFISEQSGYFFLGEITRIPYFFYHYVLSFPFGLFRVLINENAYILLRLLNVAIGFCSIYVVYRLALHITRSKLVQNLSVFMLANTLMFVFLSASISYDNLFILFSLLAVLLTFILVDKFSLKALLSFLLILVAGSLTKVTFLPIALILGVVVTFLIGRRSLGLRDFFRGFEKVERTHIFLLFLIILLTLVALQRYGMNAIDYKTLAPDCEQVHELNRCRESKLFVRNEYIYGDGRHPADKNISEYITNWVHLTIVRTTGVFAHKVIIPFSPIIAGGYILVISWVVATIRYWKNSNLKLNIGLAVLLGYSLILILENHSIYQASGRVSLAVHGRYLFAVLPILYIIGNHYLINSLKKRRVLTSIYVVGTFIAFIASSLFTFLIKADGSWLRPDIAAILGRFT